MYLFAVVDRFLNMGWKVFDAFVKFCRTDVTCASLGKVETRENFSNKMHLICTNRFSIQKPHPRAMSWGPKLTERPS